MNEKEQFIADLYPSAVKVSQETGMAWQTILAQAAQETGWGQHQLPGTHNIFNIKADSNWHGPTKTFNVWEIENSQKVWKDQSFRVYGSDEEALRDRVTFLRDNPRYAKAGLFDEGTKGHLEKEAAALHRAGYATDPHYAEGLVRVFNSPTMQHAIQQAQAAELTAGHPAIPSHQSLAPHAHGQTFLEQGAHGPAVATLQADLARLGYTDHHGKPLAADGEFGLDTRHAVERFQRDHHLTVDGKVGPQTEHALHAALHEHAQQAAVPPTLDDPRSADHALYEQALAGVRALDAHMGCATDQQSLNLAAALTVEAKREGLTRIDRVALSEDASRTFAMQDRTSLLDPLKFASVDTLAAVNTPSSHSSSLAAAIQPPVPAQTSAPAQTQAATLVQAPPLVM